MLRFLLIASLVLVGCSRQNQRVETAPAAPVAGNSAAESPHRIEARHLPNPVQVHPKVISGGVPEGDEAFAELRALGVKTVISVDGMQPDVETAKKYGLRYVHLPHGYDGIPDDRVKELAKAVRDLDGTVYIHCHHGKHRSPAAASVACVAAGLIPESQGVAILELAGTSPKYRGLYQSARDARPLEAALLDELKVAFPERAEIPPMAEAMVALGHTHDHMKSIEESGWRSPADHPDLDPPHEALLLREHFTELRRSEEVQQESEGYQKLLRDSEEAAQAMEELLRTWEPASTDAAPPEELAELSARVSKNCATCHEKYRDVPLSEK